MPGPDGLLGAPFALLSNKGARQIGTTFTGTSIDELTLTFEVDVHADTVHEFRQVNERWLRAFRSDKVGHLITWAPNGPWISIPVRKADVPQPKFKKDSSLIRSQQYLMTVVANFPYWSAPDEPAIWKDTAGAGKGKLRLRNPGDVKEWPRFIVTGPGTPSIQDGVDGPMLPLPKLEAGEVWRIDTNERRPTIVSNKRSNPWAYMRGRRFRNAIPPAHELGRPVELNVTMTGGDRTNQVLALLTPRYDFLR